jgi:hypothetical protein
MIHDLKIHPGPFAAVYAGTKTHEIRKADRPYAVGDVLHLREWVPGTIRIRAGGAEIELPSEPTTGHYTGRSLRVEVTYLSAGGTCGLPVDLCVMSIRKVHGCPF